MRAQARARARAPYPPEGQGPTLAKCLPPEASFACARERRPESREPVQVADQAKECVNVLDPFDAPEDDEPVTPEDEARMQETLDHIKGGTTITTEELRRRLGL